MAGRLTDSHLSFKKYLRGEQYLNRFRWLLQHRLDVVAEAGVPIWITEFDLEYPNVVKRAQLVEDALRLYYSHPAVEGIVLWGFWNMTNDLGKRQASLVDGPDFIVRSSDGHNNCADIITFIQSNTFP